MAEFPTTFDFSDSGHSLSTNSSGNIVVNIGGGQSYTIPNSNSFSIDPSNSNFHYYAVRSPVGYTSNFQGPAGQIPHVRDSFTEVYDVSLTTLDSAFYATRLYPAPTGASVLGTVGSPVQTGSLTNVLAMDADFVGMGQGGTDIFPSSGPVVHIVDESSKIIVNITMEGHALHPGLIVRHVYEDSDGVVWVETLGTGVGPLGIPNTLGADAVWTNVPDQSIRNFISENATGFVGDIISAGVDQNSVFPLITSLQSGTEAEKVTLLIEFFEENPELFLANHTPAVLSDLLDKSSVVEVLESVVGECFAGDTEIHMPSGRREQIKNIRVGDKVLTYEKTATSDLKISRVSRIFKKETVHLLDVHGLKVTPGHVTLCGDGQFAGKHVPIIDILLSDGALVRENGDLIRMAINKPVGSREDQFVKVSYAVDADAAREGNLQSGKMRVGTLLFDRDGQPVSVLDCILAEGMTFNPETGLVSRAEGSPEPLYFFGELPRPEDYILRRSRETLEGILTDGEWEGTPSQLVGQRLRQTHSLKLH